MKTVPNAIHDRGVKTHKVTEREHTMPDCNKSLRKIKRQISHFPLEFFTLGPPGENSAFLGVIVVYCTVNLQ
jgi:hypothetical protein